MFCYTNRLLLATFLLFVTGCKLEQRSAVAIKKNYAKAPFDVIIIPGYPYSDNAEFPLLEARMNFAKELYDKGIAHNIIFSGGSIHNAYNEARVMRIIADSLGIPAEHTFMEERAPHSYHNLVYGRKMAKSLGFKKIAVATDPYQYSYMSFLVGFAPGVRILTFSPDSMKRYITALPSIDASSAFNKDFVSSHQN